VGRWGKPFMHCGVYQMEVNSCLEAPAAYPCHPVGCVDVNHDVFTQYTCYLLV
jgi:hypothetical protein